MRRPALGAALLTLAVGLGCGGLSEVTDPPEPDLTPAVDADTMAEAEAEPDVDEPDVDEPEPETETTAAEPTEASPRAKAKLRPLTGPGGRRPVQRR